MHDFSPATFVGSSFLAVAARPSNKDRIARHKKDPLPLSWPEGFPIALGYIPGALVFQTDMLALGMTAMWLSSYMTRFRPVSAECEKKRGPRVLGVVEGSGAG